MKYRALIVILVAMSAMPLAQGARREREVDASDYGTGCPSPSNPNIIGLCSSIAMALPTGVSAVFDLSTVSPNGVAGYEYKLGMTAGRSLVLRLSAEPGDYGLVGCGTGILLVSDGLPCIPNAEQNNPSSFPVTIVTPASPTSLILTSTSSYSGVVGLYFLASNPVQPQIVSIASVPNAVVATGSVPAPAGIVDTPSVSSTNVSGTLNVTGWALSPVGISEIDFSREPNPGQGTSQVVIGKAAIVPGARPDVKTQCPTCPGNDSGWGAQILTNELPSNSGSVGVGNGTYRLHVTATDNLGQATDLGVRTIVVDNAHATAPFGTIDTPGPGDVISGTYVNFGWALTPNPLNLIPKNGSTIVVLIDNQVAGHPVYNQFRSDIATLFPGLQNTAGAVGYLVINTKQLANGLHTIAWIVADNAGNAQGIGSRFFSVQN